MPPSRWLLVDRLSWRSYTGRAGPLAGAFINTSYVLPAARNTWVCTLGTPGRTLPSSAMSENPETAGLPVSAPTTEGTCMRRPAFTKRTRAVPVAGVVGVVANKDRDALVPVLSNDTPLIR